MALASTVLITFENLENIHDGSLRLSKDYRAVYEKRKTMSTVTHVIVSIINSAFSVFCLLCIKVVLSIREVTFMPGLAESFFADKAYNNPRKKYHVRAIFSQNRQAGRF